MCNVAQCRVAFSGAVFFDSVPLPPLFFHQVMSGQLKWGVVHTEKFWREHAREVDADEFFILKQLIELLKSEDKSVVSIACYDLGEFVRFYPSGKTIVRYLG